MNRRQFIATSAAALSAAALPLLPVAARAAAPGGLQVLSTMWRGEGWPLALDGPAPVLGNYGAWLVEWQPNGWYRLYWGTDRSRSLDVINDGTNTRLHMAPTGDYSGQYWKFTALNDGYYRLTTMWRGDGMSLDVVNDGGCNCRIQLAPTGNYSGQFWNLRNTA